MQIQELSLSGNQLRADMQRRRLRFPAGDSLDQTGRVASGMGEAGQGVADADVATLRASAEVIDCQSKLAVCARAQLVRRMKQLVHTLALHIEPAGGCRNGELLVTMQPMEVRTFELLYKPY